MGLGSSPTFVTTAEFGGCCTTTLRTAELRCLTKISSPGWCFCWDPGSSLRRWVYSVVGATPRIGRLRPSISTRFAQQPGTPEPPGTPPQPPPDPTAPPPYEDPPRPIPIPRPDEPPV